MRRSVQPASYNGMNKLSRLMGWVLAGLVFFAAAGCAPEIKETAAVSERGDLRLIEFYSPL